MKKKLTVEIIAEDRPSMGVALYELFQLMHDKADEAGQKDTHGPQGQPVRCWWSIERYEETDEG